MSIKNINAYRISVLEKRISHLRKRIEGSNADLSFDKAELAALEWALKIVHKYLVKYGH